MKSYTDIEQSKKLAKILPIESADMFWMLDSIDHYEAVNFPYSESCANEDDGYPCWSLAALFGVLPVTVTLLKDGNISNIGDVKYHCKCGEINTHSWHDNPIDACVDMVEKLHELNLL